VEDALELAVGLSYARLEGEPPIAIYDSRLRRRELANESATAVAW
jgi:hypothetical protein